jgi:hypothetical protein
LPSRGLNLLDYLPIADAFTFSERRRAERSELEPAEQQVGIVLGLALIARHFKKNESMFSFKLSMLWFRSIIPKLKTIEAFESLQNGLLLAKCT